MLELESGEDIDLVAAALSLGPMKLIEPSNAVIPRRI